MEQDDSVAVWITLGQIGQVQKHNKAIWQEELKGSITYTQDIAT